MRARAIHSSSGRARTRLVSLNCAGIAESFLESELFGHAKGSFTGAYRDKQGLLEMANHGTVFLDEIGEMSLRMTARLLRFMETGEIQPVGSLLVCRSINVRIISATNRCLPAQIESGAFRRDLYYRLNVVHLKIPPLRERREDIAPLTTHFLRVLSEQEKVEPPRLGKDAIERFLGYSWPGNVRELRNVIERLIVRRAGQTVTVDDLPQSWWQEGPAQPRGAEGLMPQVSVVDQLFDRMVKGGETFWSVVYPAFLSRDLTREHLRELVSRGLCQTRGNYRILIPLFNMKEGDYRRFLAFLRKHGLGQPFRRFRAPFPGDTGKSQDFTALAPAARSDGSR